MRDVTKLFIISLAVVSFSASCVAMEPSAGERSGDYHKDRRAARRAAIININVEEMIDFAEENKLALGDLAVRSIHLPSDVHLKLLVQYYDDQEYTFPKELYRIYEG
jgi:hypothetical protein